MFVVVCAFASCTGNRPYESISPEESAHTVMPADSDLAVVVPPPIRGIYTAPFATPITVGQYFCTMDSLVMLYGPLVSYAVTEHLIVHANPWVIDSLAATDYYIQKQRGVFVADQKALVIFEKGDSLLIPDALYTVELQQYLSSILIDVNVPEYRLRIFAGNDTLYSFPVRVGQNSSKFLQLAGREVSLQTSLGSGTIVRLETNPAFINPVTGKRYSSTLRDDGLRTKMPQIPWIETELNGIRTGDMIHPTTNPETLGKAWSNGCIGTNEADAWRIYYHAPLGTHVTVRYDLDVVQPNGDTLHLPDIYKKKTKDRPL